VVEVCFTPHEQAAYDEYSAPMRLEYLLRGAPKMRAMGDVIKYQVLIDKEKAIVWVMFPTEQVYIKATLREIGIDAHSLYAHLSQSQRDEIIQSFNTKEDSYHVVLFNRFAAHLQVFHGLLVIWKI
jgi:superfamily II DNA/RNA helicase